MRIQGFATIERTGPYRFRAKKWKTTLFSTIAFLLSTFTTAEPENFEVEIKVVANTGSPIPGATVRVKAGGDVAEGVSDENGRFAASVPAGHCEIRVAMHGFLETTVSGRISGKLAEPLFILLNSALGEAETDRIAPPPATVPTPQLEVSIALDEKPVEGESIRGTITVRNIGSDRIRFPLSRQGSSYDPSGLHMYLAFQIGGQPLFIGQWFVCDAKTCNELAPGAGHSFPIESLAEWSSEGPAIWKSAGVYEAFVSLDFVLPQSEWIENSETRTIPIRCSETVAVSKSP